MAKLDDYIIGQSDFNIISTNKLKINNIIPNCGVLIKKTLFYKVGWYDPHVIMSRVCDWDLWQRIINYTDIVYAPIIVAKEYGINREDSLGNTRIFNVNAVTEYKHHSKRLERLKLENIMEYEIDILPSNSSQCLNFYLVEILKHNHRKLLKKTKSISSQEGYIYILTNDSIPSIELAFDCLEQDIDKKICICP